MDLSPQLLLEARGITKRFGSRTVLDSAHFEVREGEILGLIGPNGAGKTTLFECVAGLIPTEAGSVLWRGEPLDASKRKQQLFYLPDGIRPWTEQRVSSVVGFFEATYGTRAGDLIDRLHLGELLRSRVGLLSKGELKRTMLALGLLCPRPLLMLDEPFDGLDFRQTRDVMELLRDVPKGGRTLFLSIHQLNDAARVCHRLVLLSGGKIAGAGTVEELRQKAGLDSGGLEEVFLALT